MTNREQLLDRLNGYNTWPKPGSYNGIIAAMEEDSIIYYDDDRWNSNEAYPKVETALIVDGWVIQLRDYDPRFVHSYFHTERLSAHLQDYTVVDHFPHPTKDGRCIRCDCRTGYTVYVYKTPGGDELLPDFYDGCYCRKGGQGEISYGEKETLRLLRQHCPSEELDNFNEAWEAKDMKKLAEIVSGFPSAKSIELGEIPIPA